MKLKDVLKYEHETVAVVCQEGGIQRTYYGTLWGADTSDSVMVDTVELMVEFICEIKAKADSHTDFVMEIKGRTLRKIVDDLEVLQAEIRQWQKDNVEERLQACENTQQMAELRRELYQQATSEDLRVREVPCDIMMPITIAMCLRK